VCSAPSVRHGVGQARGPVGGTAEECVPSAQCEGQHCGAENQPAGIEQHVHEARQVDFLFFPVMCPWLMQSGGGCAHRMVFVGNDDRRLVHGGTVQRVIARVV